MLNKIWPFFILISVVISFFLGNMEELNSSIFESTEGAITLTISMVGATCLWCGIMKVASNTSVIDKLSKLLNPLISFLFPNEKKDKDVKQRISMNIIANILGIGNAATPMGLIAMESMQRKNTCKSELSDSMMMFVLINTASIQLIPTSVLAIRNSMNSENTMSILIPTWCATICSAIVGVITCWIVIKRSSHKL